MHRCAAGSSLQALSHGIPAVSVLAAVIIDCAHAG